MLAQAQDNAAFSHGYREVRAIGHVSIAALTRPACLARLSQSIDTGDHVKLAFANAHVVNLAAHDTHFRDALSLCLVLPDGIGVDIGSRLLFGAPFPSNLNGTDFTPELLRSLSRPLDVALIGARSGVAERAAERLAGLAPQHAYRVVADGYFRPDEEPAILHGLMARRADILLVAFGNPRQELWIANRLDQRHCTLALGVGALFDFLAGEVPRAPGWLRRARLEWLYRLGLEPARLWRRYVLGNPAFLARMVAQRLRGRP